MSVFFPTTPAVLWTPFAKTGSLLFSLSSGFPQPPRNMCGPFGALARVHVTPPPPPPPPPPPKRECPLGVKFPAIRDGCGSWILFQHLPAGLYRTASLYSAFLFRSVSTPPFLDLKRMGASSSRIDPPFFLLFLAGLVSFLLVWLTPLCLTPEDQCPTTRP